MQLMPITRAILREAAQFRAQTNLQTPDQDLRKDARYRAGVTQAAWE